MPARDSPGRTGRARRAGTSPRRSRRRGHVDREHVEPDKVFPETSPAATDAATSLLVAAMNGVGLERLGATEPLVLARLKNAQKLHLGGKRKALRICRGTASPLARKSSRPFLRPTAPVKAPRSCPKSSDEERSRGRGSVDLDEGLFGALPSWRGSPCATSSLPVPDSPRTSAVAEVTRTWPISS